MAVPSDAGTLFERLMTLNGEAFAAAHYNTAYHLLAAALHEAQQGRDASCFVAVQRAAEDQLAWIDEAIPAYEHSTQSATTRGYTSIFVLLARQAYARRLLLERKHSQEDIFPLRPEPEHGSV
jgi:hypothetical protein